MAFFQYTVKNEHGETIKGKVESPNLEQASAILRNRNLLVINIVPVNETLTAKLALTFGGIKQTEIVDFTRQLSTMITAGLTLTEALHILHQQSEPAMQKMIGELLREVEGGSTFSNALAAQGKKFSAVYIQLVKAGETAGVLDNVLNRLADNLEKQREFNAKVKGALIYPMIVIVVMLGVGMVMMVFVVPKLTEMYTEMKIELPLVTKLLIATSNFMKNMWWLIILGAIGGSFAFRAWVATKTGRHSFDKIMLKLPVMGVLRQKILLTEFCRTISLLLGAGISVLQALEIIAAAMDNVLFQDALADASKEVEKGVPLSQTLMRYDFFPPILPQMIAVGEETGKIDEIMGKLGKYFESESEHAVKNLTAALEPMIMIVLGLGVGTIVIAIIMPIYNLTSNL